MPSTFVDSCVLILAATAQESEVSTRALEELNRPGVTYLFNALVEMEVLPAPRRNKKADELAFMAAFFEEASRVSCCEAEQQDALELLSTLPGLQPMDAMLLASAIAAGASEFVTAEKLSKPMHRLPAEKLVIRTIQTEE